MKNSIIIAVFLIIATVFAGAYIEYFHARSEGEDVLLEWKTNAEVNVQKFVIERKTPQTAYADIGFENPKGDNSFYTFRDQNAYKSNGMIFIYRLKIVDTDGQLTRSVEATVSHKVSGVKRTWGSIKELFR